LKIKWKTLLICIAIPLIVGGIAAFISKDSMRVFETLNKPPLSPPGWIFPVAWTILYTLMGIASYLIVTSGVPKKSISKAAKLYGVQLFFNFLWTLLFFNLGLYFFAFIWLVLLWLLILATMISFAHISKPAMYLMLPYLLWVTFAGYLNLGIALLD
jgi:benzodiazapine receptor